MKLTPAVMVDIEGNSVGINTSDNHSFIGKVINVDEFNVKLLVAGAVGSTGGILNKDGQFHRLGGLPAIEYANGNKYYYENGQYHRLGGLPAIERANGTKFYY